jgi:hypothetical protein
VCAGIIRGLTAVLQEGLLGPHQNVWRQAEGEQLRHTALSEVLYYKHLDARHRVFGTRTSSAHEPERQGSPEQRLRVRVGRRFNADRVLTWCAATRSTCPLSGRE